MSTITKQWLQQKIAEMEATRDEIPFGLDEDDSNTLAAMKMAMASLEAEAVPEWTNKQCLEFLSIAFRHAEIEGDLQLDDIRLGVKMVNGSRAAMLQGADGTLANEGTIPASTPCKDAPEHIWLQTAGVWPESGEFSELTWCSDNQHKDDTLYVRADVVFGNSPVIPDGWVACSERMPEEGGRYWCYVEEQNDLGKSHYQWNCAWNGNRWWVEHEDGGRVTHWMPLPAAPQQEVKP